MSDNSLQSATSWLTGLVDQKSLLNVNQCRFTEEMECVKCYPLLNLELCNECLNREGIETFDRMTADYDHDDDAVFCPDCWDEYENVLGDAVDCSICEDCHEYDDESNYGLDISSEIRIEILLFTGGPASKLVFDYDPEDYSSSNIKLLHQDWGEQWQEVKIHYSEWNVLEEYVQRVIDKGLVSHAMGQEDY